MVCPLSGLPGTIQLARRRVVTAWFMLRPLYLFRRVCITPQPQLPLCLPLPLSLSFCQLTLRWQYITAPRKLRQLADSDFFCPAVTSHGPHFSAVGVKKIKTCCQGVVGRDSGAEMWWEWLCICIILYVKGADRQQRGKGRAFIPRMGRSASRQRRLIRSCVDWQGLNCQQGKEPCSQHHTKAFFFFAQ